MIFITSSCDTATKIELSTVEQEWIDKHQFITLTVDDSYAPLNYKNDKRELVGLNIDMINLIEQRTGLKIILEGGTWDHSLSKAMSHEVDGVINATPLKERENRLVFSEAITQDPEALVTRKNEQHVDGSHFKNKKIAAKKGGSQMQSLSSKGEGLNMQIVEIFTLREGIARLSLGEVDGVYDDLAPLYHFLTSNNLNALEISLVEFSDRKSCIGLRNDDPILLSIINKAILSISDSEKNALREKWMEFSPKVDYTLIYSIIGVLFVVSVLTLIWNWSLKTQVTKRTKELNLELEGRIKVEAELNVEQNFSNAMMHSFPGIFFMYEFSSVPRLIRWNKNHETFLDYTSTELMYRQPLSFFDSYEQSKIKNALSVLKKQGEVIIDANLLRKDKKSIPFLFNAKILEQNGIRYFLGFGVDISERNEMLRELEMHRNKLELLVEERTQELAESNEKLNRNKLQIEQRNQQLIDLNKDKNDLIHVLAHDLRSPIIQISGLAQILIGGKRKMSDEQHEITQHIIDSSQKLDELIHKILDVDAIESQKLNLQMEAVNINEVLVETLNGFEDSAKAKKISIETLNNNSNKSVEGDKIYLRQVIENLVSNAIKFSNPGTSITISITESDSHLTLTIADQGPGFTEEDQKNLFKKFQRLSAKPTAGERSTGLGLSIVKRYVDLMNGSISCESEVGKGATFHVTLNKENSLNHE